MFNLTLNCFKLSRHVCQRTKQSRKETKLKKKEVRSCWKSINPFLPHVPSISRRRLKRPSLQLCSFFTQVQTPVTLFSGELWSILVVRLAHSVDLKSRLRHVSSAPSGVDASSQQGFQFFSPRYGVVVGLLVLYVEFTSQRADEEVKFLHCWAACTSTRSTERPRTTPT